MIKRTVAILLALLLCLPVLCSCSDGKNEETVGTCAGYDILYEELRYVTLSVKNELADGDLARWDDPAFAEANRAELERLVEEEFRETYAMLAVCADLLPGLRPDSDELKDEIKENLSEAVDSCGGKKEYRASLENRYMTEHLMEYRVGVTLMQMRLEDKISTGTYFESTDTLANWLTDGNFVRVQRVTLPASASGATEELRRKAIAGNDPKTVTASEYPASGITVKTEYFYRGLGNADEEAAVFALASVGSVSETVSSGTQTVFFVRIADEAETVLAYQLPSLLTRYRTLALRALTVQYETKADVSFLGGIDLFSIR